MTQAFLQVFRVMHFRSTFGPFGSFWPFYAIGTFDFWDVWMGQNLLYYIHILGLNIHVPAM